ncbi:hypothetical protein GCM10020221_30800 [Streptomyces thioluteus]|uniref:Uncharacterized protein n=1 Tax=Streptomyces thioluteus TaxID=66431 RepID=A0ABN3X1F6_STRTU
MKIRSAPRRTVLSRTNKKGIVTPPGTVNSSTSENPGGVGPGAFGPVGEGQFAWISGPGASIAVALRVAARTAKARQS